MGLFSRKKQEDDILQTLPEISSEADDFKNFNSEKNFEENISHDNLDLSPNENLETPPQTPQNESSQIEDFEDNKIEGLDMSNPLFDFPDEKTDNLDFEKKSNQIEPQKNFNIIKEESKNHKYFFMTTSQCKDYLEILDNIRKILKESSKSCAKITEIKKEEEEELENLRKNFSKIEEKFYKIDLIISKI